MVNITATMASWNINSTVWPTISALRIRYLCSYEMYKNFEVWQILVSSSNITTQFTSYYSTDPYQVNITGTLRIFVVLQSFDLILPELNSHSTSVTPSVSFWSASSYAFTLAVNSPWIYLNLLNYAFFAYN